MKFVVLLKLKYVQCVLLSKWDKGNTVSNHSRDARRGIMHLTNVLSSGMKHVIHEHLGTYQECILFNV